MEWHFWDMDHTIINNDCDVSWKQFLIQGRHVPPEEQELVDLYYKQYEQGILKIDEFLKFQLRQFIGQTPTQMEPLLQEHFKKFVRNKIYPQAEARIRKQLLEGQQVVLLTATNREIAAPLARHLGINEIVATELELQNGKFTGNITGVYCCAEGKLLRLKEYIAPRGVSLNTIHFYGDSISDLHALRAVGHPHAVCPNPRVREEAGSKGWDIIDWK